MAAIATSHPYTAGLQSSDQARGGSRFARQERAYPHGPSMPDPTRTEQIRERLERGEYHVDAPRVAGAILERLLAGRSVRELFAEPR